MPCLTRVWRRPPTIVLPPGSGRGRPRKYAGVAVGTPHPQRVDELARRLSPAAWREYAIKDGAKGVIRAAFAFVRIHPVRNRVPGPESWLVLRRTLDKRPELKYYLSNAPATTPPGSLVWLSGLRWPVERAFQECKGELGMDHYETRTWRGWHHHQTLTILAHHFLVRLRLRLKKPCSPLRKSVCSSAPCSHVAASIRSRPSAWSAVFNARTAQPTDPTINATYETGGENAKVSL